MPEQRQAFQRELDAIDAKVIELFALVAEDLARATPALPNGTSEVLKVLTEHGLVIDLLCPEIERLVTSSPLRASQRPRRQHRRPSYLHRRIRPQCGAKLRPGAGHQNQKIRTFQWGPSSRLGLTFCEAQNHRSS